MLSTRPICVVLADRLAHPVLPRHQVHEKYLAAVSEAAGAIAWVLPAMVEAVDIDAVLAHVDGVLLPGSLSNIEPGRYGATPIAESLLDPARDAAAFSLIPAAIAAGVPLFAICRGLQELNVALGGSLHQNVRATPAFTAHHQPGFDRLSLADQYAPAHALEFTPGGWLAGIGRRTGATVNSLHGQAIDRVASGLAVEARASDGLIEAVHLPGAPALTFGVQWHPEWDWREHALDRRLFEVFGEACRRRR